MKSVITPKEKIKWKTSISGSCNSRNGLNMKFALATFFQQEQLNFKYTEQFGLSESHLVQQETTFTIKKSTLPRNYSNKKLMNLRINLAGNIFRSDKKNGAIAILYNLTGLLAKARGNG